MNVARVAELTKLGKMRPAGVEAFALRTPEKTGVYSFERRGQMLSAADEQTLRVNAGAAAYFDAQAPWYRRAAIHWVISAKKDETRARRLGHLIDASAAGQPIAPLTRPTGAKSVATSTAPAKKRRAKK